VPKGERGWGREGGRVSKKARDSGGEKKGGCERKRAREGEVEREREGVNIEEGE
jgi:hypothetical protein